MNLKTELAKLNYTTILHNIISFNARIKSFSFTVFGFNNRKQLDYTDNYVTCSCVILILGLKQFPECSYFKPGEYFGAGE